MRRPLWTSRSRLGGRCVTPALSRGCGGQARQQTGARISSRADVSGVRTETPASLEKEKPVGSRASLALCFKRLGGELLKRLTALHGGELEVAYRPLSVARLLPGVVPDAQQSIAPARARGGALSAAPRGLMPSAEPGPAVSLVL
jgi:hypothetical protein